jgi:O-antigen ligase
VRVAILMLALFTVWCFASIAWSEVKGDAWEGANRTLLYFLAFALFALLPWRSASGAVFLGLYSTAIAALALLTLLDLAGAQDPTFAMIGGRLAEPTGYHNATAALFLTAMFPALLLASRRETPWWARGILLAAAVILLQTALLPQSRGSLIAFPLVALFALVVAPGRARLLVTALPVAGATALAAPAILDVYETVRNAGDVEAAVNSALRATLISAVALLALGTLAGALDRRLKPSPAVARGARFTVGAAAAAVGVVALALALTAVGNPIDWTKERWEDFAAGQAPDEEIGTDSRFGGSLGSNRTDFWRVALDGFADDPVLGLGIDQFATEYLRGRDSDEEPDNPHSLEVKVISQTGLVGTFLFGGFLLAACFGAVLSRRHPEPGVRVVAAAGVVAFAYWFVHGSGDWLWEMPALASFAFAALGLAAAVGSERQERYASDHDESPTPGRPSPRVARAWMAPALALLLFALATLVPPWGAARDVQIAAERWPSDPEAAYERLDRARKLNPLSDAPDVIAGTIAMRAGEAQRALSFFEAARERNGANWFTELMLGTLNGRFGEHRAARAHLARAHELTPTDPLVERALRAAANRRALPFSAIDRALLKRVCIRVGRTNATPDC